MRLPSCDRARPRVQFGWGGTIVERRRFYEFAGSSVAQFDLVLTAEDRDPFGISREGARMLTPRPFRLTRQISLPSLRSATVNSASGKTSPPPLQSGPPGTCHPEN